jgi:hypothetical protein
MHCAQHMDVVADDAVVTDAIAALSAHTLSHVAVRSCLCEPPRVASHHAASGGSIEITAASPGGKSTPSLRHVWPN